MKKKMMYTFYCDEDISSKLKRELNISDENAIGNREPGKNDFEQQLKDADWSQVEGGRIAILFYIEEYVADETEFEEDGSPVISINFNNCYVLVRHKTKDEVEEETQDDLKKALTVLGYNDII